MLFRSGEIDKLHQNLDNTLEVWRILEEITMEGLKKAERQKQDISILQNDPNKYMEWLIESLNLRFDINQTRKETLTLLSNNLNMVMSFHQKENKYLEQINKGSQTEQNKLKLVSLYMDSKNYFMAKPLLEELCRTMPQSGDVYFYLGCLASQSNILRKADQYFQTAIRYDPKLRKQIDAYLQTLGDDFLKFARYFKTQPGRELSIKYMVQKGLKYNPNHSELKKELETLLKRDLKKIKSDIDTDNF